MHSDVPPDAAGSGVFGWLLAMLGQDVGFPVPRGGAQQLASLAAAADRRRRRRGPHRRPGDLGRRVRRPRRRRAAGRTARRSRARKAVLADVPAPTLYRRARRARPPAGDVRARPGDSSSGTTRRSRSTGPSTGRCPGAPTAPGAPAPCTWAGLRRPRRLRRRPVGGPGAAAAVPALRPDDHRRPHPVAGRHRVGLGLHARAPRGGLDPGGRRRPRPAGGGRRRAGRPRLRGDRPWPGTCSRPHDLQEADANLVEGAINAGTSALHQQLFMRPTPGLGRPETPVPGLYLASASAHPGGGVHGACGWNAARVGAGLVGTRRRRQGRAGPHRVGPAAQGLTGRLTELTGATRNRPGSPPGSADGHHGRSRARGERGRDHAQPVPAPLPVHGLARAAAARARCRRAARPAARDWPPQLHQRRHQHVENPWQEPEPEHGQRVGQARPTSPAAAARSPGRRRGPPSPAGPPAAAAGPTRPV